MEITIEKLAFESKPDSLPHNYKIRAMYLTEPKADALIEIFKGETLVRQFLFPAYKIWNIAAHAHDIIDGLEKGNDSGLRMAAWNGIDGAIILMPENHEN